MMSFGPLSISRFVTEDDHLALSTGPGTNRATVDDAHRWHRRTGAGLAVNARADAGDRGAARDAGVRSH